MLAWYFSGPNRTLRYSDRRKIRVGDTHKVKPPIEMCRNGLHASEELINALNYAPSVNNLVLYRVRLSGEIIKGGDKAVASERTYLASVSVDKILREFARRQALINIEKIKPYCSQENYEVMLKWLTTGDEKYKSAAWSAAWFAAKSAAKCAPKYAAEYAAVSAAKSAANDMLTEMIYKACPRMRNFK